MTGNGGSRNRPARGLKGKSSRVREAPGGKAKGNKGDAAHLIWGVHPVLDLLTSQPTRIRKIVFLKEPTFGKLQEIAESAARVNCRVAVDSAFSGRVPSDAVHQGVVALVEAIRFLSIEQLLTKYQANAAPSFFVALDCLQDPHNVGAIIRSAAAAGVSGIILPKDRSAPVSATVYKVSAGTVVAIDLCQVSNLSAALNLLQDNGIWIFGLDGAAEDTIFDLDLTVPLCLVIGSEGKGIRKLVRRNCDLLAAIPLASKVESVNASAAAAIALFEVVRQRKGK
jgi:23S rRNA (guanosine2251-2'-O)-methyltransferase